MYDPTNPDRCTICDGDHFPTRITFRGYVCSSCRVLCASCQDWMETDPGVIHNGHRMHAECAIEAREAEQDLLMTPTEALVFARLSEVRWVN